MPPIADNLNDMSWQERRRLDQQHYNDLRAAAHARINEECTCTPMTTAEAGSQCHPPYEPPRRIAVADITRTPDNRSPR